MSVGRHPDVNGNLILTVPGHGSGGANFADARHDGDYGGLYQPPGAPGLLYSTQAHEGALSSLVTLPSVGLDVDVTFYYNSRSQANGACGYRRFCSLDLSARASGTPIEGGPFGGRLPVVTFTRGNGAPVVYAYDEEAEKFIARTRSVLNVLHLEQGLWIEETPDGRRSAYPIHDDGKVARIAWAEDALGNRHSFAYSGKRLASLQDAVGRTISFGYNADELLETVTDWAGRVTHFGYDLEPFPCKPLLTLVTAPDGSQTRYDYDDHARVIEVIDAQGYHTRYEHSIKGKVSKRLLIETNGDIATTRYDYIAGQTLVTNDLNEQTLFDIDEHWRLTGITDALNYLVSFNYNNRNQETSRVNPLGHTWTTYYDDWGYPFEKVNALGQSTTLAYDSYRNPTLITRPDGASETLIWDSVQLPGGSSGGGFGPAKRRLVGRRNALQQLTLYRYTARGQLSEVEVAPDNITRYSYNELGNRWMIKDAETNPTTYLHDAAGRVHRSFDAFNAETRFTYDSGNRVKTITDPLGHLTQHDYDALGNLASTLDAKGYSTVAEHNIFDLPWRMVDAEGAVTKTLYDVLGRPIAVKDALLHVSHTEYDAAGRVHVTRDELNRPSVMHYDNAGRMWKTVDPLDHYVTYGYDNLGRMTSSINELGYATSYDYLDLERKTVMHDAMGGSSTTFYDALGRVEKRRDALGHETRTEYDVLGRQSALVDAVGFRTEFGYDKVGRQTKVVQIVGEEHHTSRTEYDERGLKTADVDARGNRTEYEYDAAGRQIKMFDATQVGLLVPKVHRYEYNSVNRLVKTTDPLGHITRYEYDGEGRQNAIVDAKGNRTEMVHNVLGQLRERHDALGAVESFAYDAVGNQVSRTDARGQITTYDYDVLNRLAVKHLTGGAVISFTYDAMGQQLTMTDASGTTTNTYDALGRVSSEVNGRGNHLAYEYDAVGHRTVLIDPEGGLTLYAPDATGQLTSLTDPQNGVTVYVRDALGRELTKTLPNGVVTQHAYDAAGRETLREERDAQNTVLARYVWLYDAVGLKTQVTELDGAIVSYGYDATHQLTREQRTGSAPYLLEYAYDAAGNRTGLTRDGVTTTSTYNAANQLTEQTAPDGSLTTFAYDADGNLSSESAPDGSGKSYFFDGQDQLVAVEMKNAGGALAHRSEFSYDDRGRLVKSSEFTRTGTSWVWQSEKRRVFDGLDTVQERGESNQVVAQLTRDGNIGGIVSRKAGTNTAFFGYDGNGNVTLLSDGNGSDVGRYRYDGFGNALEVTGSSAQENDHRFSTKELHAPSGLYYYGFRFYSPALGRWISRDPIEEAGGLNMYEFIFSNPTNLVDDYGTKPKPPPPRYKDPHPRGTSAQEASDLLPETRNALQACGNNLLSRVSQSIGNAPASWGTHYADGYYKGKLYGAAVDIRTNGWSKAKKEQVVRALRKQGLAAWYRDWSGNEHIHLVDPIAPNLKNPDLRLDKYAQVQQFLKGLDGTTAGRDRGQKDNFTPINQKEIDKVKDRLKKNLGSGSKPELKKEKLGSIWEVLKNLK